MLKGFLLYEIKNKLKKGILFLLTSTLTVWEVEKFWIGSKEIASLEL